MNSPTLYVSKESSNPSHRLYLTSTTRSTSTAGAGIFPKQDIKDMHLGPFFPFIDCLTTNGINVPHRKERKRQERSHRC